MQTKESGKKGFLGRKRAKGHEGGREICHFVPFGEATAPKCPRE